MKLLLRVVRVGLTLAILLAMGFCAWVNLARAPGRSAAEATNRAGADQVIVALKNHQRESGYYPESLQELVPTHLATLPALEPATLQLTYERSADGTDFELRYAETPFGLLPADAEHVYAGSTAEWSTVTY